MSPRTDFQPDVSGKDAARQEIQLACFRIGAEMYALDIMRIKEIIRPQKLTPIPRAPEFIEGVINLRGAVIPIVDLRKRFNQPVTASDHQKRIIICSVSGKIIGLLVDEASEVCSFTRPQIQPAPQFLKGRGAEFFLGVAKRGEDLILLLDLEKILSSKEAIDLKRLQGQQTTSTS